MNKRKKSQVTNIILPICWPIIWFIIGLWLIQTHFLAFVILFDQNLIIINYKFNDDFNSHIIFGETQKGHKRDL